MSITPLHDWLRPRLDRLLAEAATAGFEREATLAVLTDIATGVSYNEVALPVEPELPHTQWPSAQEETGLYPEAAAPDVTHGQWPPSSDYDPVRGY
jgi:hypothetical protein